MAGQYTANECNVLVVREGLSLYTLLARITELFHLYNTWELELRKANSGNLPLKTLGLLSESIFENPLSLHDASLKTIFHVADKNRYPVPETYNILEENIYADLDNINLLKYDKEFIEAAAKKEPAIYSGEHYGFRSLYINIFLSGKYAARLLVDEINRQFTDRDFALITVLGEAVKDGLQMKTGLNQWYPWRLDEILARILERHFVDEDKIKTVLAENGWDVSDGYFCLTIVPSELDIMGKTLFPLADRLSALVPGNRCIVHNDTIVCLFNLSAVKLDRKIILARMLPHLRDSFLKAGMSTAFRDFKNLYYYYQQSLAALKLGEKHRQDYWYYDFDDYVLDYIVESSKAALIPESLCPEGLLRLRRYDREEETDYVHILRVYLENNMSAAQTQRKLYMHRNTFYFKLSHLKEILDMNLEDFNIRLHLMIAFRLIDER
ncbi:MAG: helix-turn-helix domain-containing protein [Treponema sp.]|jgi:hypothetical protein|nr:helix-turn-helix domain-containing protein [Treponema sp.]